MATEDDREAPEMGDDATDRKPPVRPARRDAEAEPPADPDDLRAEVERMRAALKKANKEAEKSRVRLEQIESAELSEAERAKKAREDAERRAAEAEARFAEAEASLLAERVNIAVERAALAAGFEYPEDVPKLIHRDRIAVDEDTGRVDAKTVREAVEQLAKDRPGLLTARRGGGTPPRDPSRPPVAYGGAAAGARARGRQIDPFEQELIDMGRGGRM